MRFIRNPLLMLLFILLLPMPAAADGSWNGNVYQVPDKTGSLETALAAARDGDTLVLQKGTHWLNGSLAVTRSVRILGEKGSVIAGKTDPLLELTADGAVIEGLTFDYLGTEQDTEKSLLAVKSSGNLIQNNVFRHLTISGIKLFQAKDTLIRQNRFSGPADSPIHRRGNAVYLLESDDNRVEGNVISAVQDGIYVFDSPGTRISANTIARSRYAVHLMYADRSVLMDNQAERNTVGIMVMGTRLSMISDNELADQSSYNGCGILLYEAEDNRIEGNLIRNNGSGIHLENAFGNRIAANSLLANHRAFVLLPTSRENVIWHNNMLGNVDSVALIGERLNDHFSYRGQGNYWDDHQGIDLDRDGYGETPYINRNPLIAYTRRHEALQWYFSSPVMEILSWTSPVETVIDPHPAVLPLSLQKDSDRHRRTLILPTAGSGPSPSCC